MFGGRWLPEVSTMRRAILAWALAVTAALASAGCEKAAECEDAAGGCTLPLNDVVQASCKAKHGPGWEARVCADGTGEECEELESFGTPRHCSGVTLACCPADPALP
jgi:hypothetical protein